MNLKLMAMAVLAGVSIHAADIGKTFPTPEAAADALAAAVATGNRTAVNEIFGPLASQIVNPDPVAGETELVAFSAAYKAGRNIVREPDGTATLEVGEVRWPLPIPLAQRDGRWYFDVAAGKEELLNRRIGRNEFAVLSATREYVSAQREYASRDRDGDDVLEYAQHVISAPGLKDGLFWSPDIDGSISPLGPFVAVANVEGYSTGGGERSKPRPFHGYFFKILTAQGPSAPGGKYDYIINGNMIGGFALIAWPAEYGNSGIMTFMINQQGKVYERDLGPKTSSIAPNIKRYDPDREWNPSRN